MLPANLTLRYFNWQTPSGRNANAADVAARVNSLLPTGTPVAAAPANYTLPTFQLPPAPGPLLAMGNWLFDWLEYVAGETTVINLANDVMTGEMQGCPLVKFQQAGQWKIAHVGTGDAGQTVAAKALWTAARGAAAPNTPINITGCNPAKSFTTAEINAATFAPGLTPQICGYFEPGGAAHALLVARIPAAGSPLPVTLHTRRVMAAKPMIMLPWSAFAATRDYTHADAPDINKAGAFHFGAGGVVLPS